LAAGQWKNGDEPVRFPDIWPVCFIVYSHWVYDSRPDPQELGVYNSNGIPHFVDKAAAGQEQAMFDECSRFLQLYVRLWTFGGLFGDHAFQNFILDHLVEWSTFPPIGLAVAHNLPVVVDQHPTSNDSLRQFCIDLADGSGSTHCLSLLEDVRPNVPSLPKWLSNELLRLMLRREKGKLADDPRDAPLTEARYYVSEVTEV
jgi:hypothetical protein